ncbi:MAG: site-specific DNA-methyltransferase [Actinobacteria bacterium HGW-Actinobacteria-6]|nr:MAG: site-specific DNA-methyltransferase [Actinobacteria bacterium HGW-Actinobacteria-6]
MANGEGPDRANREVSAALDETLDVLRDIVPNAFVDGCLNMTALQVALGQDGGEGPERYALSWAGKRDAMRLLQAPTQQTLTPNVSESVDFATSANVFVEGDNLEVLRLAHKAYAGRVKMIYIDPPYNTGNDFVYEDDFSDSLNAYLRQSGQLDESGNLLRSNPEKSGRYHSAWLSMMYPRLFLARQLLTEDGVIFISIDDNEVFNLRALMNELFGEENFIGQITVVTNPRGRVLGAGQFARNHDYLLVYARDSKNVDLMVEKTPEQIDAEYPLKDEGGHYRLSELRNTHRQFNSKTRKLMWFPLWVDPGNGAVSVDRIDSKSVEVWPTWPDGFSGCWTWNRAKAAKSSELLVGREVDGVFKVFRKAYAHIGGQVVTKKFKTVWQENEFYTERGQEDLDALVPGRLFMSPKPVALVERLIEMATDPGDIVLDFFAGSGTTGEAVLRTEARGEGRRFLLIQLPEPIADEQFESIAKLAMERVRRAALGLAQVAGETQLGFRVFHLDTSNFRPWTGVASDDAERFIDTMSLFSDPLVDGWQPLDVAYEVACKEGFSLTCEITTMEVAGNSVLVVSDSGIEQSLQICLDAEVSSDLGNALGLMRGDLFVCRDVALSDTVAANLALQCRLKTI